MKRYNKLKNKIPKIYKTQIKYTRYFIYKVNKIQGCNVRHREYNQYFIISLYGVYSLKILSQYMNIWNYIILLLKPTILQLKEKKANFHGTPIVTNVTI